MYVQCIYDTYCQEFPFVAFAPFQLSPEDLCQVQPKLPEECWKPEGFEKEVSGACMVHVYLKPLFLGEVEAGHRPSARLCTGMSSPVLEQ